MHRPVEIPSSRVTSILAEMYTKKSNNDEFKQSDKFINGLTNYKLVLREDIAAETSEFIERLEYNGDRTLVHFKYFPPGAVILFKVALNERSCDEVKSVRLGIAELIQSRIGKQASYARLLFFSH